MTGEPRCGRCGAPESAHRADPSDPESGEVILALLGCPKGYAVSKTSVATARATAHTGRQPLCTRCGRQGHHTESCPF